MKKIFLLFLLCVLCVLCGSGFAFALDLDMTDATVAPTQTLLIPTGSTKTVALAPGYTLIEHTGWQDGSQTASSATDFVVIMPAVDSTGASVTMVATSAAGPKVFVWASGRRVFFSGGNFPKSSGKRIIQLKAVGHDAEVSFSSGMPVSK